MRRLMISIFCCVSASLLSLKAGQAGMVGGGFSGFLSHVEGAVTAEIEKGATFEGVYVLKADRPGPSSSYIWLTLSGKERVFRLGQTAGDTIACHFFFAPGADELISGPFALGPAGKYFVEKGFLILPDVFKASIHTPSPIELDFKGFAHGELFLFFNGKGGSVHGIIEKLTVSPLSEPDHSPSFPETRFRTIREKLGKSSASPYQEGSMWPF